MNQITLTQPLILTPETLARMMVQAMRSRKGGVATAVLGTFKAVTWTSASGDAKAESVLVNWLGHEGDGAGLSSYVVRGKGYEAQGTPSGTRWSGP